MSIKFVIDSASDIDKTEAESMGVALIPIEVMFGDEQYLDGVNLSHISFFEKLIETDELPKTSQINSARFEEEFDALTQDGSEVIAITISSKLSGTYNSAVTAAEKYAGKVYIIDSLNASVGERMLLQYALKLVNEGKTAKEICEIINEVKHRIKFIALLGTLRYLKKGGRISAFTGFVGEMMSVKPVVGVTEGEVKLLGKAIGSKKGNNLLNTLVANSKGIDFKMPYGVVYSGLNNSLLLKYIKDSEHLWKGETDNLPSYMIGSTIGTHIGPDAVGVAFFEKI